MMKVLMVIALVVCCAAASAATSREQLNNLVDETEITAFLIAEQGYPVEEHFVNTPDGYILKVFRIPGAPSSPPAQGKRVVFVQHGLLCSSADWVVLGKGKALAYLLADAGYDVWLGNARGNTNSRKHQYLSPDHKDFWNFSWHEIGQIDLPAMIDFVLLNTGEKDLHYIGHSQGTTAFFVMTSLRKEMNAKIRTMHALGKDFSISKHIQNNNKKKDIQYILYIYMNMNMNTLLYKIFPSIKSFMFTAPVAFMSKLVSPFLRV